jgi:N-acetylglucosamine-6-phosphate deacetylase
MGETPMPRVSVANATSVLRHMSFTSGYFDLQVNGYAGVDFNSDGLTARPLHCCCEKLAQDGVGQILATIITADVDAMCRRLARIVELRERDPLARQMIAGFHIEGPFINETKGYRGAHPEEAIRPADPDMMRRLLDAAGGLTKLVTLAPERDADFAVTRLLANQGIVVSAGHTDASLDDLKAAIDAGLSMFTHLGNGCPMQLNRHDNIIQRALSLSDRLWLTFIADGVHVPWPALRNYLRAATLDRCIVVTDAISAASLGPGRYTLGHWDLLVGEDRVARAPDGSHLVGSAGTMPLSRSNLRSHLALTDEQIDRLTLHNPRLAVPVR